MFERSWNKDIMILSKDAECGNNDIKSNSVDAGRSFRFVHEEGALPGQMRSFLAHSETE